MILTRTDRRRVAACRLLAVELTYDERGYIGRVHEQDVTLKTTPAFPSLLEAATSANYEFEAIVEERIEKAEREAAAQEEAFPTRFNCPVECHGAWGPQC